MSVYTETAISGSSIEDPGANFPYLNVSDTSPTFKVWKHCRVELYDPFWATEPVSEEDKPRHVMRPSQVPTELWWLLTTEEKLISSLEQARAEARRAKKINDALLSVLGVAMLILVTWALGYVT